MSRVGVLDFEEDDGGAGAVMDRTHHLWGVAEDYRMALAYFLLTLCSEIAERCSGTWTERECG